MTSKKHNATSSLPEISREAEDRLLTIWKLLEDLEKSEYPAIRAGCGRARNEIWQVIFELGLKVDEE